MKKAGCWDSVSAQDSPASAMSSASSKLTASDLAALLAQTLEDDSLHGGSAYS